ncbi:MAG: DinB family protein [Acidobacteria bacterium]|nr:DinB family protein [Acidobacteriota bacterium]
MAEEAWLNGKLEGYAPLLMPAAHALVQAIDDLERVAGGLTRDELLARPNGAPAVAFHLRHIAGSTDRLLTYARGAELSELQREFLERENSEDSGHDARELTEQAVAALRNALRFCKMVAPDRLFEPRFVGRQKLETTLFGLLFHIAEHAARHVGQVTTTARIVKK